MTDPATVNATFPAAPPMPVSEFRNIVTQIEEAVAIVMVGQGPIVRDVLMCLLGGGHVLLEGVPGLGKTMLVRTLADALHLHFSRIQFTPDLMPADIIGTNVLLEDSAGRKQFAVPAGPDLRQHRAGRRDQPRHAEDAVRAAGGDAGAPGHGGRTRSTCSSRPFFVLATQNPLEMEGTYPLPEAQLDRFFFKLIVPFPERRGPDRDRATAPPLPATAADDARVASGETIKQMRADGAAGADRLRRDRLRGAPDAGHPPTEPQAAATWCAATCATASVPRGAQAIVLASQDPRPDRGPVERLVSRTSARSPCPRCATA